MPRYFPLSQPESLAAAIERNVHEALAEDIGPVDHTGHLVPESRNAVARVTAKQDTIICGAPWFEGCLRALDPAARISWHVAEGARAANGSSVCTVEADARAILAAERSALNFLQTLSATASVTARFVAAIEGVSPNPRGAGFSIPARRCQECGRRRSMPSAQEEDRTTEWDCGTAC